jgi:hypothetical protein
VLQIERCSAPKTVWRKNIEQEESLAQVGYMAREEKSKQILQAESLNLLQHEATPREKSQKTHVFLAENLPKRSSVQA